MKGNIQIVLVTYLLTSITQDQQIKQGKLLCYLVQA